MPGAPCSGYLIQEADSTVLLDCGNGVFGKLRARIDYLEVGAGRTLRRVVGAWGDEDLVANAFRLQEYAPGETSRWA